jgi:hypothetical protein
MRMIRPATAPSPLENRVRPNETRRYTIQGKAGTYLVPTITAVDNRLRTLRGLLATHTTPRRVWVDIDSLLDWRLELMAERGTTS